MKHKAMAWTLPAVLVALSVVGSGAPSSARSTGRAPTTAVGPQYDTTHVYVTHGKEDAFVDSWLATFGGTHTTKVVTNVTPTPSEAESELVLSPVGTLSVFDFRTPVPYPFGAERTGWLMSDFDRGVRLARQSGANTVVAPFDDPIGRDAVVQFPGGVNVQLYWHTKAPSYAPLETVPDNRVYLTPDSATAFLRSYLRFTGGRTVCDDRAADGGDIGLPGRTYRRIALRSPFGNTVVSVTDGHLPYPFGREATGYAVKDLTATLRKAEAAGAQVLWGPYDGKGRSNAMVRFPGGYVAELHQGSDL
ncbi:glyoxalase [Streptomyces sp. 4503]|uniref:Glyoxalase n=1 Tax=Streptomyces niphimycinicus TaxID=2842201 RepID=A0ABS6CUV0_9ACTN|nr:glyoxalase [Streptomyces niphimycinicus]MBU3870731.1 glyoxalase [Streptomyces niphimycinicus]